MRDLASTSRTLSNAEPVNASMTSSPYMRVPSSMAVQAVK